MLQALFFRRMNYLNEIGCQQLNTALEVEEKFSALDLFSKL